MNVTSDNFLDLFLGILDVDVFLVCELWCAQLGGVFMAPTLYSQVVIILPTNRKDRYDAIKKFCCVDHPGEN